MNKLLFVRQEATRLARPLALLVLGSLSVAFWVAATPSGLAQGGGCTVCHKRTTPITLSCTSLEYRRHVDHGDTLGPCEVTPTQNP
ncbi:MAG TPA: hypothetical protein VF551_00830 [Chthoniobacterales bacterium]